MKFDNVITKIDALSPMKTMARGYAITEKDGKIIKKAADLEVGDEITLKYIDGEARAKIQSWVGQERRPFWGECGSKVILRREKAKMEEINFEKSMEKLEKIAEELERDDLSLDDSVKLFEEGMELSKKCNESLQKAEKKITVIIDEQEKNFIPSEE